MKRKLFPLILLGALFFAGCNSTDNAPLLSTAISQIDMKSNGHIEQLSDYDSPYTACFRNKDDTYSLYIFASPIQYETDVGIYAIIDNTVVESNKTEFAFENKANSIKTYFPQTLSEMFRVEKDAEFIDFSPNWDVSGFSKAKQTVFINMYGDKVSAVIYERNDMDLAFYPTKAGIKAEIILKEKPDNNEFSFKVKSGAASFENKQNGYILFKNGGEIENIIYQPLVQYTADKGQLLDVTTQMSINREGDDYYVEMIIDENIINNAKTEYPINLDPSFEMYLNKMPDSTIYSGFKVNNYLCHYAVIGEHPILGEGLHFARLRLNYYMTLKSENVKSTMYFIKPLCYNTDVDDFKLYKSVAQWSSTQMLWESKSRQGDLITSSATFSNGYLEFPMSDYVKECFDDPKWKKEAVGFLMKVEKENAYSIMTTSDNSLYTPFLKIDLIKLPAYFEPKNDINQVPF